MVSHPESALRSTIEAHADVKQSTSPRRPSAPPRPPVLPPSPPSPPASMFTSPHPIEPRFQHQTPAIAYTPAYLPHIPASESLPVFPPYSGRHNRPGEAHAPPSHGVPEAPMPPRHGIFEGPSPPRHRSSIFSPPGQGCVISSPVTLPQPQYTRPYPPYAVAVHTPGVGFPPPPPGVVEYTPWSHNRRRSDVPLSSGHQCSDAQPPRGPRAMRREFSLPVASHLMMQPEQSYESRYNLAPMTPIQATPPQPPPHNPNQAVPMPGPYGAYTRASETPHPLPPRENLNPMPGPYGAYIPPPPVPLIPPHIASHPPYRGRLPNSMSMPAMPISDRPQKPEETAGPPAGVTELRTSIYPEDIMRQAGVIRFSGASAKLVEALVYDSAGETESEPELFGSGKGRRGGNKEGISEPKKGSGAGKAKKDKDTAGKNRIESKSSTPGKKRKTKGCNAADRGSNGRTATRDTKGTALHPCNCVGNAVMINRNPLTITSTSKAFPKTLLSESRAQIATDTGNKHDSDDSDSSLFELGPGDSNKFVKSRLVTRHEEPQYWAGRYMVMWDRSLEEYPAENEEARKMRVWRMLEVVAVGRSAKKSLQEFRRMYETNEVNKRYSQSSQGQIAN